jgi:hypothetical protein
VLGLPQDGLVGRFLPLGNEVEINCFKCPKDLLPSHERAASKHQEIEGPP